MGDRLSLSRLSSPLSRFTSSSVPQPIHAMPHPITQAQPPLEFIPPNFDPLVCQLTTLVLPTWMRWQAKLADVQVNNLETLVQLYQQFQAGKIRLMLAFRHPSTDDPYCMYSLLSHHLPRMAKRQQISLKSPTHAHFMYDRGIPLWAGHYVGWLYSRLGGTPIRRGKLDLVGLRSARQLFTDGRFPMAAAPEGATNGHNEIISPIEPGIAQLGFWCVEDLVKAGRMEEVLLLPIGIQYYYVSEPWQNIAELLSLLEKDTGLPPRQISETDLRWIQVNTPLGNQQHAILYKRLIDLGEHLLSQMEEFYSKFYHQTVKRSPQPAEQSENTSNDSSQRSVNESIAQRLNALLNTALTVAENYFGISPKGSFSDRCRRLEQAGWDWIYREDLKQLETLSPLERGLADRIAEEANLRLWHMRLVESFVSVTGQYVLEKPTVERFAETVLLLWDMVTRIKGRNPFFRPKLGTQRVKMTIGNPISVSDRWDTYKTSRRQAVAQLTQTLEMALEAMITV